MLWLLCVALQIVVLLVGARRLQKTAGAWIWLVTAAALGFAVLECLLLILPLRLGMAGSRWFASVWIACWILAALNLVGFLAVCRRWRPRPPAP
jgi:hypothetical protein